MSETTVNGNARQKAALPSDMEQVKVVAKYDILKYIRSRRLLGIIAIEAVVLALITVLITTSNRTYTADGVIGEYTNFVNILIILGATLFGGDAIVSEFQGRTGYLLFPNPVKKVSIMAGKFISSVAAMSLILVIYYVVAVVAGLAIGNGLSTLAFASLGLAVLYGISAISVAYLISSVMKGSTGALILTFAMFFLVFNIVTSLVGTLGGIKPWFMLDFAGTTLSYVTMSPYPMDRIGVVGSGDQTFTVHYFYPDLGISIAVMVAYIVVALILAYVFFKRREMAA